MLYDNEIGSRPWHDQAVSLRLFNNALIRPSYLKPQF
jgi:hypothetical protein